MNIINRYTNTESIERLLLLIATFIKYPGIGCPDEFKSSKGKHHNALEEVRIKLRELARSLNIDLPDKYPAIATLRKDLELLRNYGVLEPRMYRWGYYLGTGVMSKRELKVAFDSLKSQAKYQGDSEVRRITDLLEKRLKNFEFEAQDFFYPVRQNLNRAINYTDPQEMMNKGEYRHTLFHQIKQLEEAIIKGQVIELSRISDPHQENKLGCISLYPLQMIYYDIAWYLIYENSLDGTLSIGRINRFKDYLKVLDPAKTRSIEQQRESLNNAHKLIENGWGLKLGDRQSQQLELLGKLALLTIKVRFFPPVSSFIAEGELRHPKQVIEKHQDYLDYSIKLPPRSLPEFRFWLNRYGDNVIVLSPSSLREQHCQTALSLWEKYQKTILGLTH